MRHGAGFQEYEYMNSIQAENLICINSDSKSGQVFWKSKDGNIILKTIVSITYLLNLQIYLFILSSYMYTNACHIRKDMNAVRYEEYSQNIINMYYQSHLV